MSAWLVTNFHVNALAAFAADQGLSNRSPADVALDLWVENRASLRRRYEDADQCWEELPQLERLFRYEDVTLPDVWHVLKAVDCYSYQACEHEGWLTSVAKVLCDAIEARAIDMLRTTRETAGRNAFYEAAPWGLEPVEA